MRIYLRAFELDDYRLINRWRSDPEIIEQLGGNVFFVSSERERKWIEEKIHNDTTSLYLAICLNTSNDLIGYLSVTSIDLRNRKAEVGIIIGRKDIWHQGYAKEAIRLILSHLFFQMGLQRVYAFVLETHENSLKLFQRAGFTREGVLRDNIFKNNRFHNMVVLSILKNEFESMIIDEKDQAFK